MKSLYLLVPLAPLVGAIIAGLFGKAIGRANSHRVTIVGVFISLLASLYIGNDVLNGNDFNGSVYTWSLLGDVPLEVGFLIDRLTVMMMVVVTFVSLMVHIYTIGYMEEDPGYERFFAYISLFTFSMLMLVMSNNFLQLFFGWEAVGLVSYLLIGFWYTRPTAIYANLKAFLVNRVGDFGFLLGIGLVLAHFGSLDYAQVFAAAPGKASETISLLGDSQWLLLTVICVCLFIGAMGKSAQFPLHVWLPDSMEGPTPISALIHAATMVTAGIFMVARMSPLFELSTAALSFVMVVGAITMFFMALIAIVQYDIKRVVAYSTLSQLGYMTVALGASAYGAAVFHLFTHAFFKAVLFLGAGSVIIAMHHEQDMRRMGGLRKYMKITYFTVLIGAIANAGLPPFAGFFSKETIVEAVHYSNNPAAGFAYVLAAAGVFVSALYSFRLVFYAFHGKERFDAVIPGEHDEEPGHDEHDPHPPHETRWVVTLPLVLLSIPAIVAGFLLGDMVYGDFFGNAIVYSPDHPTIATLREHFHGHWAMVLHAFGTLPFWLAIGGLATAWVFYILKPEWPGIVRQKLSFFVRILENKYGFDDFNQVVFGNGAVKLGTGLWKGGDVAVIDGFFVNGSARTVGAFAKLARLFQSGFIYRYAFTMIIGLFLMMTYWLYRSGALTG
ncbi:MAG TPA: NADH-quinone oxidoreductase subunit L [Burkholderiales bacterium]|nr:NADH-quinone oxidoreductase subunit L [Burkholderiales bacterium]